MEIDLEAEESLEFQTKVETLLELIPDADPEFLRAKSTEFVFRTSEFQLFVNNLLEKNNYPRKVENEKTIVRDDNEVELGDLSHSINCILKKVKFDQFLQKYPNPVEYFESYKGLTNEENCLAYLKHKLV